MKSKELSEMKAQLAKEETAKKLLLRKLDILCPI
jgi:hypothetical protein